MPLIEEKFDQSRIDSLKRYLQREADKDRVKDFEIIVDGFKVVSRTNDIEEFDDYEQELRENSRNISFLIYDGPGTNRNTRYSFILRGEVSTGRSATQPGLGEIDQVVAQKLEEKEREHEVLQLREKLSNAKETLAEAEEYAEQLEKQIEDMKQKRYVNAVSLGELASVVLKSFVRENAAKIPGGQALAGWLGTDNTALPVDMPEQVAATFTPVSQSQEPITEEVRNRLSLIEQMQEKFNEQQMVAVFAVLDSLVAAPEKIGDVAAYLGIDTAQAAH